MKFLQRLQDSFSRPNPEKECLEQMGSRVHVAMLDRVAAGAMATNATIEQLAEEAGIQEGEVLDQLSDLVECGHYWVNGDGDVRSYHMVFRVLDPTGGGLKGEPPGIRVSGHWLLKGYH